MISRTKCFNKVVHSISQSRIHNLISYTVLKKIKRGVTIIVVTLVNIEMNAVADASYISLDGVRNNGAFQKKTTHSVSSGCFGIKRQLKLKYGDYDCVSTREIK